MLSMSKRTDCRNLLLLGLPAAIVFVAFFVLPVARLVMTSGSGRSALANYLAVLTTPRYFASLLATIALSAVVTLSALVFSTIAGLFLQRNRFPGREALVASLSDAVLGSRIVFAYSMMGLYVGYLYFSIPRVIVTVMAAAEKLDPALEEAARSLGASTWQVVRDVIVLALRPALTATGAICFATAMGAFGTAFTLATNIDVLPMTIYTEFTLEANVAMAAVLSLVLGAITWGLLYLTRSLSGPSVVAA